MSELISGKEAKLAWASGEDLLIDTGTGFHDLTDNYYLAAFDRDSNKFKRKPRTITINGVEVPAPFDPKEGEACCFISDESVDGYHTISYNSERYSGVVFGLYRPSDIEQVVAALRGIFKPSN